MKFITTILKIFLLNIAVVYSKNIEAVSNDGSESFSFPSNFLFGTASSAYQYEGAYSADGKGLNNWDVFTHQNKPGYIVDGSNGDIAVDHYHRYLEDIELMDTLGVNSYRFSISWARILPKGRFGGINMAGIEHYNKLIDSLLLKGIQPFVTLSHLDFPQEMEIRYGSWLSPKAQEDFGYLADTCFKYFGDRVKHWTTFNEPNFQAVLGYRIGTYPPSRCSFPFGDCTQGDSEKEPFIVAHNIILAHANAAHIYRTKYQKKQRGTIGIVLHAMWFEPLNDSTADKLAVKRAQSFFMNWFLDPIIFGKYPEEMTNILGATLPRFTNNEIDKLKKGLDFIGINHYSSSYIQDCLFTVCDYKPGYGASRTEGYAQHIYEKDGVSIGESTDLDWLRVYPDGMYKIVKYIKDRYNNTPMIITENGYGDIHNLNSTIEDVRNDVQRVHYMSSYINSLIRAIREGADVRGYFTWSLLDDFEWLSGYTTRFGLHHVDYSTLKRSPKLSATWFKEFLAQHSSRTSYTAS